MPIDKRWFIADLCAFVAGIVIRVIRPPGKPPQIPLPPQRAELVSQLEHYMFHPLVGLAMVVLFFLWIFRRRFIGIWSVVASFIIGGILASVLIAPW
jgi:hypothetical protein